MGPPVGSSSTGEACAAHGILGHGNVADARSRRPRGAKGGNEKAESASALECEAEAGSAGESQLGQRKKMPSAASVNFRTMFKKPVRSAISLRIPSSSVHSGVMAKAGSTPGAELMQAWRAGSYTFSL